MTPVVGPGDQVGMAGITGAGDVPGALRRARTVLAICAHPDDESCGLGALIAMAVSRGKHVSLVTCTHGEAGITPGWRGGPERLARAREGELGRAVEILGIHRWTMLDYPDGRLAQMDAGALDRECLQILRRYRPDVVLAYDPLGVTCHPDHVAVGEAVVRVWRKAPAPPAVLFWTIPEEVAAAMCDALGDCYVGRPASEVVRVDVGPFRERQRWAVAAHASQSCDLSPQFALRLELCGPFDHLTSPQLWGGRRHGDPSPSEARLNPPNPIKEAT